MGTASSPRKQTNDQMSTPDGLDKTFVSQNNEMRHFARIESPVELVRAIARREAPSVFFVLFDLRPNYREQTTGAMRKSKLHGSLKSPVRSWVSITLPASS